MNSSVSVRGCCSTPYKLHRQTTAREKEIRALLPPQADRRWCSTDENYKYTGIRVVRPTKLPFGQRLMMLLGQVLGNIYNLEACATSHNPHKNTRHRNANLLGLYVRRRSADYAIMKMRLMNGPRDGWHPCLNLATTNLSMPT